MNGLKIHIILTGGKWLINNKRYQDCSRSEKMYFDQFLRYMSQSSRIRNA